MRPVVVSVIIPTHRRPTKLRRALASVEAQTRPPDEVVVVDDPCGRGAAATRNEGAARTRGRILAFLDDDDEWLPGYLKSALELLDRESLDIVCTDLLLRQPGRPERLGKTAPDTLRPADFLTRNPGLGGSNTILRRELFATIDGFDETLPTLNDMDFGLRLALTKPRYRPHHRPLVVFNHHDGPRLSIAGSVGRQEGLLRFYSLHAHRMVPAQQAEFQARMVREGVDQRIAEGYS